MTPSDRSAARQALDSGRDIHARLDQIRGPRDAAADINALWTTVENAMRAMLGGSSLSGQTLVRELRQRNLLSLGQANTLAAFWDANERSSRSDYSPTLTDVGHARRGYTQLYEALDTPAASPIPEKPPAVSTAAPFTKEPSPPAAAGSGCFRASAGFITFLVVLGAALLIALAWAFGLIGRSSYEKDMQQAIEWMGKGQTQLAKNGFTQLISKHPDKSEPRVYFARIARQEGDIATARQELVTAIQLDRDSQLAQREMGMLLLSSNQPALAVNFLKRALEINPDDPSAQGYLGCALIRTKQEVLGRRFLERAGPGAWSSCATQ